MKCPNCGNDANYIKEYDSWYCYNCKAYLPQEPVKTVSEPQIPEAKAPFKSKPIVLEVGDKGIERGVLKDFKGLLRRKSDLITDIAEETGYGSGIKRFAIALLIPLIIYVSIYFFLLPLIMSSILPYFSLIPGSEAIVSYSTALVGLAAIIMVPIVITSGLVLGVLNLFIGAGINHIFFKAFGGKGNYQSTFKILAYSNIPGVILSIIPIANLIGAVISLSLMYQMGKQLHNLSGGRVIGVMLMPLILIGIIYLLLFVFGFSSLIIPSILGIQ